MSDSEASGGDSAAGGSLWGGRFEGGLAPAMVPLNLSLDVDIRIWREDVRGSRAWARALVGAGVLTPDEAGRILAGLDSVAEKLERDGKGGAPDEDIHSLVERLLFEEIGAVAGKLHTGRSRNDQVATDMRLWGMAAAARLDAALEGLCRALHGLAARNVDWVMPGYTHLQRAQPIRAAHWALSHFWPFARDRERIRAAGRSAGVLPLGSGALAGCPFPVDREALRQELGFHSISENSIDAVSDRDWMVEMVAAGSLIGVHLARISEDLVLFASSEFGFVKLPEAFSTGSSLMPQKRNPDVAELVRGKAGRLVGNLTTLLMLIKGLPTGYNRDLQEDKRALFDSVATLELILPALAGALAGLEFQPDRLTAALDDQLLATDVADYLVKKGVPFRASHDVVGRLVKVAEQRQCGLSELPLEVLQEIHPLLEADLQEVFSWERSVDARAVPGGTARSSVEAQLGEAERRLDS